LALFLLTFIDFAGSHHPEMGCVFVGPAPPPKKEFTEKTLASWQVSEKSRPGR